MVRQSKELRSLQLLFVGEEPSPTARVKNYRWEDGRLCAKQLFDAFDAVGFSPKQAQFINLFDQGIVIEDSLSLISTTNKPIIAMGKKVQKVLAQNKIAHFPLVHPAARGKIRLKENYTNHVSTTLKSVCNHLSQ